MLKQVQMTRSAGYRLQGLGSREQKRLINSRFYCNWGSYPGTVLGSPSLPELVSGSGFDLIQGRLSLKHGEIRFLILIF